MLKSCPIIKLDLIKKKAAYYKWYRLIALPVYIFLFKENDISFCNLLEFCIKLLR